MKTGEHLVGTQKGVFRVSTVMRRPQDRQLSKDLIKAIAGCPREPVPGHSIHRIPAYARTSESEPAPAPSFAAAQRQEPEVRNVHIRKQLVEDVGATTDCRGCKVLMSGRGRAKHSDEC